jgi:glutathionylspermidine amidase/synthetase
LHNIFLNATKYVVENPSLHRNFNIPEKLWPKIEKSWKNRKTDIISGRFDFSLTPNGLKVYEYNADSASCLLECGEIQNKWSEAAGIDEIGNATSTTLFKQLKHAWWAKRIKTTLHVFHDDDVEETYHALYMKAAAEAAGIKCKVVRAGAKLTWTEDGDIKDEDGTTITNLWKSWSWRTAINQLKDDDDLVYIADPEEYKKAFKARKTVPTELRLVDVFLHPNIRVIEPLWTVLPSCKALLPVLTMLYPGHPYLLHASYDLTIDLKNSGYVSKPITGRCGENVALFDDFGNPIEVNSGNWVIDDKMFQELCMLPKINDMYIQINTWAVGGNYAGVCIRADESSIIKTDSSVYALRMIRNE